MCNAKLMDVLFINIVLEQKTVFSFASKKEN